MYHSHFGQSPPPARMGDIDWEAAALVPLDCGGPGESEEQLVAAASGSQEASTSHVWKGWRIRLPAPRARSREQHILAAARMREARAAYRAHQERTRIASQVNTAVDYFREAGLLLDSKLRVTERRFGGLVVKGGDGRPAKRLPPATMLAIAFSKVSGRNDVARSFKVHPATVGRIRAVVAQSMIRCESALLRGIAQRFATDRPTMFVVSLACDATKHKLSLKLQPGQQTHMGRSSWNCLVSRQRFGWTLPNVAKWFQTELVRPNVPVVSDSGEALLDGLYELPAIGAFKVLEISGLTAANIAISHYDLDGHAANLRMVAGRRACLPDGTLVSARHCGNHANNLVEGCVIESVSPGLLSWLYSGSLFLGTGGHFLRLIHCTTDIVRRFMDPPAAGDPPAFAKLVAHEIQD